MADIIGDEGNNYLFGTPNNDIINGGAGDDSFFGGTGDSLNGGVGEDELTLYLVDQTIGFRFDGSASTHLRLADGTTARNGETFRVNGGSGNDIINGGAGDDVLLGELGNDILNGGAGNDTLIGGEGNITLNGGAGDDSIFGVGTKSYTLNGGTGNDQLYGGVVGNDIINGGAGDDTLNGDTGDNLDGGVGEDELTLYLNDQTAGFRFDGSASTHLRLADGTTVRNGETFIISGGSGNDTLIGAEGNDFLSGEGGNDTLLGGDGNDVLDGGAGNDLLVDGDGRDQFLFDVDDPFTRDAVGIDVIQFFSHNHDMIVLDKTTFTTISSAEGIGFSSASEFAVVGSNSSAANSTADIVYNSMNGNLFYNPNGSAAGFGTGGHFATLADNRFLSSTDFTIWE